MLHKVLQPIETLFVGERGLAEGQVEYRERRSGAEEKLALDDVVKFIQAKLGPAPA